MAKFAANLTMLFNEVDFLQRFEKAHQAGFKAIEFLFPYDYEPQQLAQLLEQYQFEQALFNMPPGDWDAGEKGGERTTYIAESEKATKRVNMDERRHRTEDKYE